jgi:hypothetical protein
MGTNCFACPLKDKAVFCEDFPWFEMCMKYYIPLALMIPLLLAVAACTPVAPASEEVVPTERAASAEPYHPLTSQTGIQTIDQVLQAVASGDPEALRALIEFTNAVCTHRDGLGGPPKCREGEAEGMPVEVLAFLGSEGGHLRKDEMENWSGIKVTGVYAIYEVNASVISSEEYYPLGKYVILFVDEEDKAATALRIGERGIVRIDDIIDSSSENLRAMIEREASQVILPPKS